MNTGNETQFIETDVLILGGGLAGCFAAMKASEHDVKVTIIEKNYLPYSGSNASGIDHFPYCFIPEVHGREGYAIEDFVKTHTFIGNGIVDQELTEMMWEDSYDRLLDIEKVGIKIRYEKIYPWNYGYEPGDYPDDPKFRIVPWHGFKVPPALNIEGRHIKRKLDSRLNELNIEKINRTSIQGLLTRDDTIIGAVGFDVLTGKFLVAKAKATILATGSFSRFLPTHHMMSNRLVPGDQTGEGQVMAYIAGAELAVMEQYPWLGNRIRLGGPRLKGWTRSLPATPSGYPAGRIVNAAGEAMPSNWRSFDRSTDPELEKKQVDWIRSSMREGKTPFYWDATAATEEERKYAEWSCFEEGGGHGFFVHLKEELGADLSTHQIELDPPIIVEPRKPLAFTITSPSGVVINKKTETTIKGLYATGELAYGVHFPSSPWAYASGARAGHNAADFVQKTQAPEPHKDQIDEFREEIFAPLRAKPEDGVTWEDMNWQIGNIVKSYLLRANPHGLKQGLDAIMALKKEDLQANNPHELMRAMETRSLLIVTEMFLRAALCKREENEWRILRRMNGKMYLTKKLIEYKYPVDLRR